MASTSLTTLHWVMENRLGIGYPLPMITKNSAHTQQDLFNKKYWYNDGVYRSGIKSAVYMD